MRGTLIGAAILGAIVVSSRAARAADDQRQEPDRGPSEDETRERRNILVGNTLGIVLGRVSFDFGTFVAPHVVPTGSLHGQATVMFGDEQLFGVGGELGMRLYGGALRPTGPFVGAYAVGGRYSDERGTREVSIISYGGAADVGWSFCTRKRNVIVALGVGAELRSAQEHGGRMGDIAEVFLGKGPRPRALVQVGAFF
jgi:hypothetical protein